MISLTTLGCSGSFASPAGGACSGYLVRAGGANIWMDCGNGTFAALQRQINVADLSAVVITHTHPDHCVDVYGLHVFNKYAIEREGLVIFAPKGSREQLGGLIAGGWGDVFDWNTVGDCDTAKIEQATLSFSRTDHPVETLAVQVAATDKRLVYTSDTGPRWSPEVFGQGADLLLSEATYLHHDVRAPIHLSARQAGELAGGARAKRLVLTHLWPTVDPVASAAEGSDAFGSAVALAAPGATLHI